MKVSVIISLCDNRFELFSRSLNTWVEQTKKNFEIIIVDDSKRDDILNLCKNYTNLNFQFVRINNSLCDVPITTFTPVLSNNVGARVARGEVICFTGPETLQNCNNIKIAESFSNRDECGFGLVYKSNKNFVNSIKNLSNFSFDDVINLPGAKNDCLSRPPHPPAYFYFVAVAKKHFEKIGGLDERFGQGFCAEDDDFANRIKMYGISPVFETGIVGIHQDHSVENTEKHLLRYYNLELRKKNFLLMQKNLLDKKIIVNEDHLWGDPKTIIYHEVFY
jgi:glycosyltransferase involved in cell wall biosynthesis